MGAQTFEALGLISSCMQALRVAVGVLVICIPFVDASSQTMFKLRQSINIPGLKILTSVIAKPSIAVPQHDIQHLDHLNLHELKSSGVKCLVFDKDNTLSTTYSNEIHPSVSTFMGNCRTVYSPAAIAILSNSVGTRDDTNHDGAKLTEIGMNIPVILHAQKKPACLEEVLTHFEKSLGHKVAPSEICMIGDRLLTDVVFANRYGMVSVLVKPIDHYKDHKVAVVLRYIERAWLLPLIRRLGYKNTRHS